jgi:hypothetical protein
MAIFMMNLGLKTVVKAKLSAMHMPTRPPAICHAVNALITLAAIANKLHPVSPG